ncbi:hypothetical protein HMPREF0045_01394 [Actinomyces graevenitzii C83]|uniref:Uncharacterized protein n=1 Tax=Actinomyces graevenitzii C83 TaxID=435830 RepID=G9PGM0_9ACTO|nr:hypothetical protein HMPREF0045_01394 [Actinomyces graevenitzii C83]
MAYGARLESVLGASPRGFESPILRHRSGTVRFRIFYALFTPAFPGPTFLDDAAPRTAHRTAYYRAAPCAVGNKKSRHALHDGN